MSQIAVMVNRHTDPTFSAYICQSTTNYNIYFTCYCFTMLLPYVCLNINQQKICPSHAKYMLYMPIISCAVLRLLSLHISYELTASNTVIKNTGLHTLNIISICSLPNVPVTKYIHILLHYYCTLETPYYFTYMS